MIGHDAELGREGPHVALPLIQNGSTSGYLVLVFASSLPRHVELALRRSSERLSGAFPALGRGDSRQRLVAVS